MRGYSYKLLHSADMVYIYKSYQLIYLIDFDGINYYLIYGREKKSLAILLFNSYCFLLIYYLRSRKSTQSLYAVNCRAL